MKKITEQVDYERYGTKLSCGYCDECGEVSKPYSDKEDVLVDKWSEEDKSHSREGGASRGIRAYSSSLAEGACHQAFVDFMNRRN
jgi:hypothetical protein